MQRSQSQEECFSLLVIQEGLVPSSPLPHSNIVLLKIGLVQYYTLNVNVIGDSQKGNAIVKEHFAPYHP